MKSFSAERFCVVVVAGLLLTIMQPTVSTAAAPCDPWVARMVSVQGVVEVRRAGQTQWVPARLNDLYCGGDQVQVGERSRADLTLINQPVVRLDQNTTISLGGIREQRVSWFDLVRGALYFFSRMPRNLEVRTAFVNAGIEGTEGLIIVESNRTLMTIFEGTVLASNPSGSLTLAGGQSAIAEQGRAPVFTVVVRPRDAVRWAIYYPPTLNFRPEEFPAGPGWQGAVRNSLEAYMKGDFQAAFESIKGVPDTLNEPRFFAYRASLLLAVGRFDEASRDIEQALRLNPNYSDAFALQSIVAVAQNEKERARELAQRAVTADPKSASALIALSYTQQANFDLDGALSSLQQAVQVSPDNALAWARLAELWLSFGQLSEALEAAKRAVALNPNLSRTQTVLGFAFLTQVNTEEAKKTFERAIELDQADPLPRLGLGLAKIREGDLEDGRREIEIAVGLDPDNALIRSYLGKAYFEEKRDEQSAGQYEMSKQLDPKDPTPYFYDAIRKQTTNRPVEALQDMQKAIELNDNRAVYRSRLLLDSDLAARSAALGRIYSDLGFQQLGLVEGWKSVNTDPSNFSAHRFLADSYSVLPRHEIARVSELLQSQLLQPLNMTPIQPHLAESNLFLISAGGPAGLSFNEFNPLFNRNGLNFQTTGLAGENSTYAGEGVLSGIYNKAAFSLGGFHFQTDGWRTNADQRDAVANAFLQFELSPKTSIQAEYRYRNRKNGDLQQRFFPDDFFPGLTDEEERHTYRLGGRHSFSPNSILLGSFMYSKSEPHQRDNAPPLPIPFLSFIDFSTPPIDAFSGELQHLFRSKYFNLTSGLGYFKVNGVVNRTLGFAFPPPPFGPGPIEVPSKTDISLHHINGYTYAYINPVKNVTITAGFSFDSVDGDSGFIPDGDKNQFNPKFGITWNPFPDTTVRAAAFRVLKRTLITDQTLEPTQVAGFNQFFDDRNVTEAWRYGAAIDQKFTRNIFGGVEFSKRDLTIPLISNNTAIEQDGNEYMARTYLFWTPHPWLGLKAEYMFERIENEDPTLGPKKLKTHRVPLGINFFHPSGFSASLTGTYWNQNGEFQRIAPSVFGVLQSGRDDFWTVDAAISYRLPNRLGFITVGAANLFDRKFKYFDTDRGSVNINPRIIPDRVFFGRLTLALP
jgi:tetratricopeptide (TPR) repeat protein